MESCEKALSACLEPAGKEKNIVSQPVAEEKPGNNPPPVAVTADKSAIAEDQAIQMHDEKPSGAIGGVTQEKTKAKDLAIVASNIVVDKKAATDSAMDISSDSGIQAFSEVVVTGYDAKRKRGDVSTRSAANVDMNGPGSGYIYAEPAGGKEKFDEYISVNQKKPAEFKPGSKVTVVLSFIVDNSGIPQKIKVVRSPSGSYSEEAIRLLKEGPEWKPATRNGNPVYDETRLKIIFR